MKPIAKLTLFAFTALTLSNGVPFYALQDAQAWTNNISDAASSSEDLQRMALPYLRKAERDARRAAIVRAAEFRRFIVKRSGNARRFAEEIMGWRGTWEVLWGYWDRKSHEKYLAKAFGKHFFTGYELKSAMGRSIKHALKDMEEIENQLAVDLQTVVLGRTLSPGELAEARRSFQYVMDNVVASSRWDASKTVGKLVAADLIAGVTSAAMANLAVSMTVMGLGTAASPYTFGVSIVVVFMVDCLIDWIDDPASDIARDVRYSLREIAGKGETSILTALDSVITQKRRVWDRAAKEALQ